MKRLDPVGSLKYLAARLNPFSNTTWVRHRPSGLRLKVNVRDAVGRQILRYQGYETDLTEWLLGQLQAAGPSATFVDIGANLGWYSLRAAYLDNVSTVVSLEPELGNQQLLRTNIQRNGLGHKIHAIACAAGAAPGLATLHHYKASNEGRHSLAVDHGMGGGWVCVEALDMLLERLSLADEAIAAIKIDVEGFEPEVLRGATQALQRAGVLLIELSPELMQGGSGDVALMIDAIAAAGFRPKVWDGTGRVPTLDVLRNADSQITVGFAREAV